MVIEAANIDKIRCQNSLKINFFIQCYKFECINYGSINFI